MSQTKQDILSSALDCFISKGVEQTTIADIRDKSGISVGSIYHHFANKENIAVHLYLSALADHSTIQEQALSGSSTAQEGVKAVVCCYVDWITDHPDWARFVFRYRAMVENSALAEEHEAQRKAHFQRLIAWFSPYIDNQEIKKLPFEVYHSLIIGPAQDFALRWLAGKTRGELSDYRDLYAEAAWQAIKN